MHRIRISSALTAVAVALPWAALPQADDPNALVTRAVQMQSTGDYAAAAEAYGKALKLRPDDVASHVNLGVVLVNLGRFSEAIEQYKAAERLLPGDKRIALDIALAYQKSGRLRDAVTRFETLHAAEPGERQVTMLLADGQLQLGDDSRVIELLQPLEAQDPANLGVAYMLGTALLRKGRVQDGQVLLDRILRNGDTPEARFLLGTRMFESGDYPAAVKELASAIRVNPDVPQLESFYGQALLATGDPDGAANAFRRELAKNPNDYQSSLGLAQILNVRKQFIEAMPLAKRTLLLRPDSGDGKLAVAESLLGSGQPVEARAYAQAAEKTLPDSFEAHRTLSSVYEKLGLAVDAEREQRKARDLQNAADPGPKNEEAAPDFSLASVSTGKRVALRDFRGKSPVMLIFGSYSCPNFRSSAEALKMMSRRYGARIPFLLVYIREAHAEGNWQSTRNVGDYVPIVTATTLSEKQQHAAMCSRKLHLPFPAVVDGMDGGVERSYNAWPSRAFVIGRDGRVVYSTRLTELDFHPNEVESALRKAAGDGT